MGRSIGLAIDFSGAGFLALRWAACYLTDLNRKDKLYIIHVRHGNSSPWNPLDISFDHIEGINPQIGEKWKDVVVAAWDFRDFASAKICQGEDIPQTLKYISDELSLDTLVVGSAAREDGGSHTMPEVCQTLVQSARCSIVVAKNDRRNKIF